VPEGFKFLLKTLANRVYDDFGRTLQLTSPARCLLCRVAEQLAVSRATHAGRGNRRTHCKTQQPAALLLQWMFHNLQDDASVAGQAALKQRLRLAAAETRVGELAAERNAAVAKVMQGFCWISTVFRHDCATSSALHCMLQARLWDVILMETPTSAACTQCS
jgi:hypothetical protein